MKTNIAICFLFCLFHAELYDWREILSNGSPYSPTNGVAGLEGIQIEDLWIITGNMTGNESAYLHYFNFSTETWKSEQEADSPHAERNFVIFLSVTKTHAIVSNLGSSDVFSKALASGIWMQVHPIPPSDCPITSHGKTVNHGNYTYVFGGRNDTANTIGVLCRYDFSIEYLIEPVPHPWSIITHLGGPSSLEYHSMEIIDDIALIFGGIENGSSAASNSLWMLNMTMFSFHRAVQQGDWPPARYGHCSVATMKDDVVIYGGTDGSTCLSDIWLYSSSKATWFNVTTNGAPGRSFATCIFWDRFLYIFGGNSSTGEPRNDMWSFEIYKTPPNMTYFVVSDPDHQDKVFSVGDVFYIVFDRETNAPEISDFGETFEFVPEVTGANFSCQWVNSTTLQLRVTHLDPSGEEPAIGSSKIYLFISANITTKDGLSLPSKGFSPELVGSFGDGPYCNYSNCSSCTSDPICGWCASDWSCLEGNVNGSIYTPCDSWDYKTCINCSSNDGNCESCAGIGVNDDKCVYCIATGECARGNSSLIFDGAKNCILGPGIAFLGCPGVGCSVVGLQTTENETFNVTTWLDSQVTDDVSLSLSFNDSRVIGLESATFLPSSLSYEKLLASSVIHDHNVTGNYAIQITAVTSSLNDNRYNGLTGACVAIVRDIDTAELHISCNGTYSGGYLITQESSTAVSDQISCSLSLSAIPLGNLTIGLVSSDTQEGTVSPSNLMIEMDRWNEGFPFFIRGRDDYVADGNETYSISISADSNNFADAFDGISARIDCINIDNDTPGISLSRTATTVSENGDGNCAIVYATMSSQPTKNVLLLLETNDTSSAVVSPSSLLFTPEATETNGWSSSRSIFVCGINDEDHKGNIPFLLEARAHSEDQLYDDIYIPSLNFILLDDDVPNILWKGPTNVISPNNNATMVLSLRSRPKLPVSIALTPQSSSIELYPSTAVFNDDNFREGEGVIVTLAFIASREHFGMTFVNILLAATSLDKDYDGTSISAIVTVDDGLTSGFLLSGPQELSLIKGECANFSISLRTKPSSNVVIPTHFLYGSDDNSLCRTVGNVFSPAELTFKPTDYNSPQDLSLCISEGFSSDVLLDVLIGPSSSSDRHYNLQVVHHSTLLIKSAAASLVFESISDPYIELGVGCVTYMASLGCSPEKPVQIKISIPSSADVFTAGLLLPVFSPSGWNSASYLTVCSNNTVQSEPILVYELVASVLDTEDPAYLAQGSNGKEISTSADLVILDSDMISSSADVLVSSTLTQVEEGECGVLYCLLSTWPCSTGAVASLSASYSPSDFEVFLGEVSESGIGFSSMNRTTPQRVSVCAVGDGSLVSVRTAKLTLALSGDGCSDVSSNISLSISNTESAGIFLFSSEGSASNLHNGGQIVQQFRLNTQPAQDVVLIFDHPDTVQISPSWLGITTLEWNSSAILTVTGVPQAVDVLSNSTQYHYMIASAHSMDEVYNNLSLSVSLNYTSISTPVIRSCYPRSLPASGGIVHIYGEGFSKNATATSTSPYVKGVEIVTSSSNDVSMAVELADAINYEVYFDVALENSDGGRVLISESQECHQGVFISVYCPYEGVYGSSECITCPSGADCPGGNRIYPLEGFSNLRSGDPLMYQCESPVDRCKGGEKRECREDFAGDFCSSCSQGHFQFGYSCSYCNVALTLALVVLWMAVNAMMSVLLVVGFDTRFSGTLWLLLISQTAVMSAKVASVNVAGDALGNLGNLVAGVILSTMRFLLFDLGALTIGCLFPSAGSAWLLIPQCFYVFGFLLVQIFTLYAVVALSKLISQRSSLAFSSFPSILGSARLVLPRMELLPYSLVKHIFAIMIPNLYILVHRALFLLNCSRPTASSGFRISAEIGTECFDVRYFAHLLLVFPILLAICVVIPTLLVASRTSRFDLALSRVTVIPATAISYFRRFLAGYYAVFRDEKTSTEVGVVVITSLIYSAGVSSFSPVFLEPHLMAMMQILLFFFFLFVKPFKREVLNKAVLLIEIAGFFTSTAVSISPGSADWRIALSLLILHLLSITFFLIAALSLICDQIILILGRTEIAARRYNAVKNAIREHTIDKLNAWLRRTFPIILEEKEEETDYKIDGDLSDAGSRSGSDTGKSLSRVDSGYLDAFSIEDGDSSKGIAFTFEEMISSDITRFHFMEYVESKDPELKEALEQIWIVKKALPGSPERNMAILNIVTKTDRERMGKEVWEEIDETLSLEPESVSLFFPLEQWILTRLRKKFWPPFSKMN